MNSCKERCVVARNQGRQLNSLRLLLASTVQVTLLHRSPPLCRLEDADIMDAVFVSRPSDLSDLEDILPSLDDVLSPQADFASDSEMPLWDSMLSSLSCPGMESLSNQTVAPGLHAGAQGLAQSSTKDRPEMQAYEPSPSKSACSCDAQHVLDNHLSSQQGLERMQTKASQQQQQQQVQVPDEPTSSRDSNAGVSSPDTGQDKGGSGKKRKMDDSDEDCSGRHPSPVVGTSKVLQLYDACVGSLSLGVYQEDVSQLSTPWVASHGIQVAMSRQQADPD